jgi:hypothetical protein
MRRILMLLVIGFVIGLSAGTVYLLFSTHRVIQAQAELAGPIQHTDETARTATSAPEAATTTIPIATSTQLSPVLHNYVEVTDSCGPHFEGACANIRSGPSTSDSVVLKARTGMVLAVDSSTVLDADGRVWYRIIFDEWVRYPERVSGDWYIASDFVHPFQNPGPQEYVPGKSPTTTKHIVVNRTKQMMYAYDGDELFLETPVSTGLELTPTPRGTFTIFRKVASRYMQGPIPGISDQYYDLPGVPWSLYFTEDGGAIHGAYWHNNFGSPWSHGCVNLPLDVAQKIFNWADVGTQVLVTD